ncbi:MAG: DUF177 domain-containing protein [Pseudomonadota bacterium]
MTALWSRPTNVRHLADQTQLTITATDEERAAMVETLDLSALDQLSADIVLRSWRGDGVRVEGRVMATLSQPCGVTLEPVPSQIDERFDVKLHPDAAENPAYDIDVDVEEADPPERLVANSVDVGAIALEHFVLALDPYPRAPGAEFELPEDFQPEEEPSPFAVLASLKKADS